MSLRPITDVEAVIRKFGQAAAYGFILTAIIILFTFAMFVFRKREYDR